MSETTPPAPRPKGLSCLHCRGVRFVVLSRSRPTIGVRLKYIRCRDCKARMKLQERIIGLTRPAPPPEIVPGVGTIS